MAISVTDPIGPAMERVKHVLFAPFRFKKCLVIALGAWLWLAGEGGLGFSFPTNFFSSRGGGGPGGPGIRFDVAKILREAWAWISANMYWLLPVVLVGIAILFAFYLLNRWLAARGTFIFFDNIVNDDTRIAAPWRDFRELAWSLFRFRILWDLLVFNVGLAWLVVVGALLWPDFKNFVINGHYDLTGWTWAAIIVGALGMMVTTVLMWFFRGIVFRLAIPVMFVRRMKAWPAVKTAWRELFVPHKGACLGYFLFSTVTVVVRQICLMVATMVALLGTCCTLYCVLFIPVIGQYAFVYPLSLLSLPVLVFDRSYVLHFISQFGPDYQIAWQTNAVGGFPVIMDNPPMPPSEPGM
jgi:hypothetical protein